MSDIPPLPLLQPHHGNVGPSQARSESQACLLGGRVGADTAYHASPLLPRRFGHVSKLAEKPCLEFSAWLSLPCCCCLGGQGHGRGPAPRYALFWTIHDHDNCRVISQGKSKQATGQPHGPRVVWSLSHILLVSSANGSPSQEVLAVHPHPLTHTHRQTTSSHSPPCPLFFWSLFGFP